MPRTTRKKRTYKKRVARRRGKKVKRDVMRGPFHAYSGMDPFGPFKTCSMTFAETVTCRSSSLGAVFGSEQIYRLNVPWDPRFATGGDSVYGWNQVALLYNKYKINSVRFKLIWSDPTADGMTLSAQIQPANGTYTLTGARPGEVLAQPMSITRVLNHSGSQKCVISQYIPIHVLLGVTKLQYKADLNRFIFLSTGTTPATNANVCFLRIAACNDRDTSAQSILCRVEIIYNITWFNRNTFAPAS